MTFPYRGRVRLTGLLPILLAASCAAAPAEPVLVPDAPPSGLWSYDVAPADDLARIDVRLRFHGIEPRVLELGDGRGAPFLTVADGARGRSSITPPPPGATLVYRVDLAGLADAGLATRVGRSVCVSPGLWLLRPATVPSGAGASLRLAASADVAISAPWPTDAAGRFLLDETAFRWRGLVAFGRLARFSLEAEGARLDVAALDRPRGATDAGLREWLADAARAQVSLYGEFPVRRAQVIVRPVASNEPVAFGETLRGGGAAVVLRLGDDATDASLASDWVAVHEFIHLGMPAIADDDAWLSEGFVTYFTEVLRGRAGLLDEAAAWEALVEGFARGRRTGTGRRLRDESAAMERTHAYHRVYWAGAAMALLLDVEMRRGDGGGRTLDDAMREVRRALAGSVRSLPADEVLAHLDAWLGRPLFSETAGRHVASRDFPAVEATLARLGVVVEEGRFARLDDAAPDAAIRRAILGK